jgi:archaellum component FlaC
MSMSVLAERCSEKFGKKLVGRTDMEDALKRLDKLTQEEARMAAAQNLKATHIVDDRVRGVANTVAAIDNRVASVDNRVAGVNDGIAGVDNRIAGVDDRVAKATRVIDERVRGVGEQVAEVINGTQVVFSQA